jgi:magnesium transporter
MLKDVFAVNAPMDREEVALQVSKKRFLAVPVIDNEHHILGTIKTEELLSYTQEEATEDIQKMFGAGGDEKVFSPIWFAIRKRLPWLYINLGTAFLAAFVIGLFENIIAQITVLAVFLPVVAGQGGNAGTQTLAIVIRGLALKEVSLNMAKRVIFKEGLVGIINGAAIGIVTALIAWLWGQNPFLGVIIGLAMIVNMVAAGVSGAVIPLTMKSLGWDPAQSSSIFLTTVTDIVGFASFLSFAVLFQQYLL